MNKVSYAFIAVFALLTTGCFHAQVTTGLPPGDVVWEDAFANSWIGGLVPPKMIDGEEVCESGVAMVDTDLSFLNQLVGAITMGIYTPMRIRVTCAASDMALDSTESSVDVAQGASEGEVVDAFEQAVESALETGETVYVRFAK